MDVSDGIGNSEPGD